MASQNSQWVKMMDQAMAEVEFWKKRFAQKDQEISRLRIRR
jgi:hypothetical protein